MQGPNHASQEKKNVLIWRKPYHVTNSSHVIGHFLRTLRSLRKTFRCMRYVGCVRKAGNGALRLGLE